MNGRKCKVVEGNKLSFKHLELTSRIVGVFFEVYGELGYGFLESVYRQAMGIALREADLAVQPEAQVHALFRGHSVGVFRLDFVVEQAVIVELKAARGIDQGHLAQVLNYLRCTSLETGLILNFGPRPQIRRVAFTNSRKTRSIRSTS
jgi:GxxExxY protein